MTCGMKRCPWPWFEAVRVPSRRTHYAASRLESVVTEPPTDPTHGTVGEALGLASQIDRSTLGRRSRARRRRPSSDAKPACSQLVTQPITSERVSDGMVDIFGGQGSAWAGRERYTILMSSVDETACSPSIHPADRRIETPRC